MHKLPLILPSRDGNNHETRSEPPTPTSRPDSPQSTHRMAAAAAADRLFNLLPPLDVSDPHAFIAATTAILAAYPAEVWAIVACPVRGIPGKTARPTLADIKKACDVAFEPIERAIDRRRAAESHRLALPPPQARTLEQQAAIDDQVAGVRQRFGIPPNGLTRHSGGGEPDAVETERRRHDGRHHQRIAADLEARRARNESGA